MKCTSPITVKQPEGMLQMVSCGHCLYCSIRRQQAWVLRMILEAREHGSSSFVTLTYAEDTRPGTLVYEHISQFLKRWRKSIGPVRFFCVGEYGKKTNREHWHLIMFGVHPYSSRPHLTSLWPHGITHTGTVTPQSASYVARYSLKTGVKGGDYVMQCSRRPGIGLEAIRNIGHWMARKHPALPVLPTTWRLKDTHIALDRSSVNALAAGYEAAGGTILNPPRSRLRSDLEARIPELVGDPRQPDFRPRLKMEEWKDQAYGAF